MRGIEFLYQGLYAPTSTKIRPQGHLILPIRDPDGQPSALVRRIGLEMPQFRRLNDLFRLASEFRRPPEPLLREIKEANVELRMALDRLIADEMVIQPCD